MRIGIDARFYGGEQSKGLGRYTQKLIEYLAASDAPYEFSIFLTEEGMESWSIADDRFRPVLAPYRWYTVAEQLHMPRLIARENVDFMHFPHFNVPLFYRKPFVVTVHDLIILRFPTRRASTLGPLLYGVKQWAGKQIMQHAVRGSKELITVSEFSKHDIVSYYDIDADKVTVTYEAADAMPATCSAAMQKEVMQQYGIDQRFLLYIGNAYPHKNIEILVQTIAQWKKQFGSIDWKLVLVGKRDYFYERVHALAAELDVLDHIVFTGFVPDEDLACLYQSALAYIFPSLYEGFGLPPLEAMHYGTPVLAANTSCLPEVLGSAAEYFDPTDISGIITAIHHVIDSEERRSELVEAGYARVESFSWERMMHETRTVYERIISTITEQSA